MKRENNYPLKYYRIAIGLFFFLQGTVFATWSARIPDIKQALSLSDAQLGTILFFFPLGQLVSVPLSGYLVQKYGSRVLLSCVALLYPLSLVGIGLMPSRTALAGMLFLLGVVANLHNLSVNTQAVSLEKRYGRSIMGTFHGLWSLAGFVAGLTSSFLAVRHVAPLWHFCGVLGFGLLAVATLHRFLLPEDLSAGGEAAVNAAGLVLLLGFMRRRRPGPWGRPPVGPRRIRRRLSRKRPRSTSSRAWTAIWPCSAF